MDKKKVKDYIQRALVWIDPMTTESANYETAIKMAAKNLEFAIKELSKSDWVSVDDGLSEYGEEVLVCNKKVPDSIYITYRTDKEKSREVIDNNKFYYERCLKPITHWKPIEKLEE